MLLSQAYSTPAIGLPKPVIDIKTGGTITARIFFGIARTTIDLSPPMFSPPENPEQIRPGSEERRS